MGPTQVLQEIRTMRGAGLAPFEEENEGWNAGRLTQAEAARILGLCERSFRRDLASKAEQRGAHRKRRERSALPGMMIHQDGSAHEWVAGQKWDLIVTMDDAKSMAQANRYLAEDYLPAFNADLAQPAIEEGAAFVPWIGGRLDDALCEQYERTVSADNCVRFETLILQIPADRHRCHYVKARVRVHRYVGGNLAVFHGPHKLADCNHEGKAITQNLKQAYCTVRQVGRRGRKPAPGCALRCFPHAAVKADNSCAKEPDKSKNPR